MSHDSMKVGLVVPDWEDLARVAREAEELGYDFFASGEHIQFHGPTPNAFVRLAFAAGATDRIRLMSLVTLVPLYPPVLLAKLVAELAVVSQGRFELGVGVGGENPAEFEAVGVPVTERGRRTDTALDALSTLLDTDAHSPLSPLPVEVPTMWVAGRSDASLRRAVRYGGGWIPYMVSPSRYRQAVSQLGELGRESGRPWSGRLGLFAFVSVGRSREDGRQALVEQLSSAYDMDMSGAVDRYGIFGTPEQCLEGIHEYHEAGVDTLIARPIGDAPTPELNRQLYEQVLGRLG